MITIVTEIAKYLIIFFMVLYTVKCFTVLKPVPIRNGGRLMCRYFMCS